jgi:hypothetical protein
MFSSPCWLCLLYVFSAFNEMISSRLFRIGLGNTHGPLDRSAQLLFSLMYMLTLMIFLEGAYPVMAGDGMA